MDCDHCGAPVRDKGAFCSHCGGRIKRQVDATPAHLMATATERFDLVAQHSDIGVAFKKGERLVDFIRFEV